LQNRKEKKMEIEIEISKEELENFFREKFAEKIKGEIIEMKGDIDWCDQYFNGLKFKVRI